MQYELGRIGTFHLPENCALLHKDFHVLARREWTDIYDSKSKEPSINMMTGSDMLLSSVWSNLSLYPTIEITHLQSMKIELEKELTDHKGHQRILNTTSARLDEIDALITKNQENKIPWWFYMPKPTTSDYILMIILVFALIIQLCLIIGLWKEKLRVKDMRQRQWIELFNRKYEKITMMSLSHICKQYILGFQFRLHHNLS